MIPGIHMRVLGLVVALLISGGLLAACTGDDDDADAEDEVRPITATPTAVAGLPEDILELTVAIEDGSLDTDPIEVTAEQPVMITVANRDAEPYTFVVEGLVDEIEIAEAAETFVNFNAPNSGEFEGQLLDANGEEVSTFFVNVSGPGGT